MYREDILSKNLKEFKNVYTNSFIPFCLKRGTKQNRHSHSVAESKNCTVNDVKGVFKILFPVKKF